MPWNYKVNQLLLLAAMAWPQEEVVTDEQPGENDGSSKTES